MRRLMLLAATAAALGAAACFTPVGDGYLWSGEGADASAVDATAPDAASADAGTPDAGPGSDAATPDASCSDPAAALAWYTCTKATDQASCEAAKGKWVRYPRGELCECPTGQAGCPCTKSDDCLGACIAPVPFKDECPSAGTCASETPTLGCHCWFYSDAQDKGQAICVD